MIIYIRVSIYLFHYNSYLSPSSYCYLLKILFTIINPSIIYCYFYYSFLYLMIIIVCNLMITFLVILFKKPAFCTFLSIIIATILSTCTSIFITCIILESIVRIRIS